MRERTVGSLSLTSGSRGRLARPIERSLCCSPKLPQPLLHRARTYDAEREKRREAEVLARAREDVLGVVAHDLRNPLNLIQMDRELMLDEDLPRPRRGERCSALPYAREGE